MTKDEALRLALEALSEAHYVVEHRQDVKKREQAITAIKAALEAKDEPVAWAKFSAKGNIIDLLSEPDDDYTPLYTTPPQRTWVGLTNEETIAIELGLRIPTGYRDAYDLSLQDFAKAIEAKLKEKNG
jgi:hypothetical protein